MNDAEHELRTGEANVSGVAARIPKQPPPPAELAAGRAVLRATIQVKRAATGKVEEFEIIGTPIDINEAR